MLTWPEGNAWLVERLAAPLAIGCTAGAHRAARQRRAARRRRRRVEREREQHVERWSARAGRARAAAVRRARLLETPPAALARGRRADCATRRGWSPTCISTSRSHDRPGAPPAWDNVIYGSAALGYVDAMHQSLRPHAGPTVLTAYWALGGDTPAQAIEQRRRLLARAVARVGRRGAERAVAAASRPARARSRTST